MAPRSRRTGWQLSVMTALCLLLSPAGDAAARKFQMSGTWIARDGRLFLPLQFATAVMDTMTGNAIHQSMGNLSGAFGFPNGPIPGAGDVTATGSAPATLRIPPHRFVEDAMALIPQVASDFVQITTHLGVDAPYDAATLAPGLGPGSFTWCPGDPACAAMAAPASRATDPPQGAAARNGRVIYRAGVNRFGGAMQLGLRRGGYTARLQVAVPFRVGQFAFWGTRTTLRRSAVGGLGSPDAPSLQTVFLPRAFVTQPTMVPGPFESVRYPGPRVTTMMGLSTTGSGPVYYLPQLATGPMGTLAGQYTTHYGFGQTTGTVIAQQTTGGYLGGYGQDFFTVMGSDARTPLGAGNLSLVAGGLSFRTTPWFTTPFASFHKVTLTLGAPIPSLSPAGVAAAAVLVLLAAGWALRKRLG